MFTKEWIVSARNIYKKVCLAIIIHWLQSRKSALLGIVSCLLWAGLRSWDYNAILWEVKLGLLNYYFERRTVQDVCLCQWSPKWSQVVTILYWERKLGHSPLKALWTSRSFSAYLGGHTGVLKGLGGPQPALCSLPWCHKIPGLPQKPWRVWEAHSQLSAVFPDATKALNCTQKL